MKCASLLHICSTPSAPTCDPSLSYPLHTHTCAPCVPIVRHSSPSCLCFASPSSPGCSVCAVKHLCHHYGAYSHHGHLVGDDAALPTRTAVPCSAFRLDRSADLIDAKGALPRHQARFTLIVRTSSARVIERRTTGYLTDDGDGLQGVHLWWRGVVTILSNMWALRAARSLYSL